MKTKTLWTALLLALLLVLPAAASRTTAENKLRSGNQAYFDGKIQKAKNYYSKAVAADRTWAIPYNNRGLAYCHLGQFAKAKKDFDTAKSRDAAYVAPYLNRGKCLAAQGNLSQAVAELEAGLKIAPGDKRLLFNLAWVQDELGELDEALRRYGQALAIDRNYPAALAGRAITLAKSGKNAQAVEAFYERINAKDSAGNLGRAIAAYNLQLLRGPGLTFPSEASAVDFAEGVFLLSVERYDPAVESFESALASAPAVADAPWLLYWTHLLRRDGNAAANRLDDAYALMPALEVDTTSATAQVFLDGIYRGDTPASIEVFRGRFDLSWRSGTSGARRERTVVAYSDDTPGGASPITVQTVATSKFTPFFEETDRDRDWLGDAWEKTYFGNLSAGPDEDSDGDGSLNLYEYWNVTTPAAGSPQD